VLLSGLGVAPGKHRNRDRRQRGFDSRHSQYLQASLHLLAVYAMGTSVVKQAKLPTDLINSPLRLLFSGCVAGFLQPRLSCDVKNKMISTGAVK